MPVFSIYSSKVAALNEEKTRGVTMEFPTDMKYEELLSRINELRDAVIKSQEEAAKKEAEKPVEATVEEVKA